VLLTRGIPVLLLVLLWLYCLFDAIGSDGSRVRNLPKVAWVFIILFFIDIGGLAWLIAGRPRRPRATGQPHDGRSGVPPEYDRPGRAVAKNPDDDAEFLEQLKHRAEEQRRKAAEDARRLRDGEDQPPQA